MSGSIYTYLPLDSQLREIRLLSIAPGCFDDPVECHLVTASFTTQPIYKALSYVWGAPVSSSTSNIIILDGKPFSVTTNLLSALRHLRSPAGGLALTFWVDAVCINQQNLNERSQQVAMMRDIYASAERVVIWLGEEGDGSDEVFDALPVILEKADDERQEERRLNVMRECSSFFFGLADSRPWFSRVWILQELAMAKQDPLVVCGGKHVQWSMLMKAWQAIAKEVFTEVGMIRQKPRVSRREELESNTTGRNSKTYSDGSDDKDDVEVVAKLKVDVLDDLYNTIRSQGGESLRKLLMISRTSESTDSRDRIYALLGLLSIDTPESDSNIPIPIDYRKPASAVYADAMSHIFSRGEGPYFLSGVFLPGVSASAPHIQSLPLTTEQPNLPSWVPDFSRQMAGKSTQPVGTIFHPPAGIGASGVGADCSNGKQLDERTLQVEGLIVDTIEQVISLGSTLDVCIEKLCDLESVATEARRQLCQFTSSIAPLMEHFKNKEPLWRTLVSNKRFMSGYDSAPSTYEAMYLDSLNRSAKSVIPKDNDQRSEYERCLEHSIGNRCLFTTRSGFVGTCVPDTCKGDVVAIIFGSPVPFVLRPATQTVFVTGSERQTHSIVGASYVSGIMGGEMVDELYCEDLMDSTTFFIQ